MPGLYVHIPFCERKCIYCDFYSIEARDTQARFLGALEQEILRRATPDARFGSIFFGGGTPSLLEPPELGRILDALRSSFAIDGDAEISVECNPGTVDEPKLAGYRALGVNRLSFGVQSFHADDLAFLTRIHSARDAEDAVAAAHRAGFDNVNIDLMFSLPGQTPAKWLENLERALALGTTHLSCYSLTVEQGTPLAVMVERGEASRPPEDSDADLFELTMRTLESHGFEHYEVSNYAREGFACRHNLTYWRHEDYLGFGPSAHSTWRTRRIWNTSSLRAYIDAVEADASPAAGGEDLTADLLREEYVYLRLRSEGIDLAEFRARFGTDIMQDNEGLVTHALTDGLLALHDGTLRLTHKGFLVCDELCAELR